MRHLGLAISSALLATVAFAGTASAHHPTEVSAVPSCAAHRIAVDVGFGSFGDDHYMRTTIVVNGTTTTKDSAGLTGDGTLHYSVPLVGTHGTVTVTAQAKNPDGTDEGAAATTTATYSCPRVVIHLAPRARILGPCGDPMHGWVMDNSRSDRAVRFTARFRKYGVGWVTRRRVVAAHAVAWSGWKHVTGNTRITVKALGKVLATEYSAAPGNYRACPTR